MGIGTTSPAAKLSVTDSANNTVAIFTGPGSYAEQQIVSGAVTGFIQATGGGAHFGSRSNNDLLLDTGAVTKLIIKDATGYVGIGTASPGSKLEIRPSGTERGLTIRGASGYTGSYPFSLQRTSDGYDAVYFDGGLSLHAYELYVDGGVARANYLAGSSGSLILESGAGNGNITARSHSAVGAYTKQFFWATGNTNTANLYMETGKLRLGDGTAATNQLEVIGTGYFSGDVGIGMRFLKQDKYYNAPSSAKLKYLSFVTMI